MWVETTCDEDQSSLKWGITRNCQSLLVGGEMTCDKGQEFTKVGTN